jgi:hypothetical protein
MADLEPRRGSGRVTSRRQREQRAYRLVVAGGTAAVVAVVGLILAALGVVGAGVPVIAAIIAVVCLVMVRRTVGSR